jgi:uncharacterized repeat protein (TIGR03803 family)
MQSRKVASATKMLFAILSSLLVMMVIAAQPAEARNYKFKVLHTFKGAPNDGGDPAGVLVRDSPGNLYGTTAAGGSGQCSGNGGGCGTAFKMNAAGKFIWIHNFKGPNGFEPLAGLLRDKSGNLYGTTSLGGNNECSLGCGTVFKLDKNGKESVLHKFSPGSDGHYPEALLVGDEEGDLFGTTYLGGTVGYGTVFKVDKNGKETILHNFAGPPDGGGDGAIVYSGVIRDTAGDLYGVTFEGGVYGVGTVYEVSSIGDETLLYSFKGGVDGAEAGSVLVADKNGNLYGTTQWGGNGGCFSGEGCGTVFELSPHSDGSWTEKVLYVFCSLSNCADGEDPVAGPLVIDAAGNLYGTTNLGGAYANCNGDTCGTVFKLDITGKETVLHSFTGGKDGAYPRAGLTMDAGGNVYGVAEAGGDTNCYAPYGCGVVFEIVPQN